MPSDFSPDLPFVGAAMNVADLDHYRDWLLAGQRDLELQDFCDPAAFDDLDGLVAHARSRLDGYTGRLGIHGAFYDLPLAARDPEIGKVVQHRLAQDLDAAEALGATHIVIHSPFSTWDHNNLPAYPDGEQHVFERCNANMAAAVKRAESAGICFVIENIEDKDPAARVRLAKAFNSPAVKVSIDTGHAHYAHGSTGAPPVDYYVRAAGTELMHIHLQDADGHADRHWPPGKGTVNWHAVFAALKATGATPRLILELADVSRIMEGADWLVAEGLVR